MEYKCNLPYPEVKVEKKNIEYAKMLSNAYAGNISEDTAIHLYMYQSIVLNNEVSDILEKIAVVEMHHLELLAKAIYLLGLDPMYKSYTPDKYFNGQYIRYQKDLNDILEINIISEEIAIDNYEKLVNIIDDKYIKELLNRIILDEKVHLEIFKKLKKTNKQFIS